MKVKDALLKLRENYILKTIDKRNNELYFALNDNNKIIVHNEKFNLILETYDFLSLFKDYDFSLIEDNKKEEIDNFKDKEYYEKIQKRQ